MMKDNIFIVTHKKLDKYVIKKGYSYIQVNTAKNGNYNLEYNDFDGDNISIKNPNFCELTAVYWIWKNYKCNNDNIIGLCHYRRFFSPLKIKNSNFYLSMNKIKKILKDYDIIVPKKFKFDVTTYEFYDQCAGKKKDLDITRDVIIEKYPDYVDFFDEYCNLKEGHYLNMMICKKRLFDDYCKWLFDILFEVEKRVDLSDYSVQEARIFGYISELLLNVYCMKNNLKEKSIRVVNTEA